MAWFFLESFTALGATLALVCFFLLVHWRRNGNPRPLLIGLALGAVLLGVQAAVVTPCEQAGAVLTTIERDLRGHRLSALAAALAPEFRVEHLDREAFLTMAQALVQRLDIHSLARTDLRVESATGDALIVRAAYTTAITLDAGFSGPLRSRWQVRFAQRDGRWQITSIAPPMLENTQFQSWRALGY